MKKPIVTMLAFMVLLIACKKDTETVVEEQKVQNPAVAPLKLSCNVDGSYFETDSVNGTFTIDSSSPIKQWSTAGFDDSTFIFMSYLDNTILLDLPVDDTLFVGEVDFQMSRYKNGIHLDNYTPYQGYLLITSNDTVSHLASGKFVCFLRDTVQNDTVHLTNGRFTNVTYTVLRQ